MLTATEGISAMKNVLPLVNYLVQAMENRNEMTTQSIYEAVQETCKRQGANCRSAEACA
jgi:hypothetical protein